MSAKIKRPAVRHSGGHRPRNESHHSFEKVYWPFIPVIIAIGLLLPSAVATGAFTSFIKHPTSRVLSYATSENPKIMLADTNNERKASGEPALQLNSELSAAAMAKAKDMATRNYWSHDTPNGDPPWIFVTNTGYSYQKLGENLATGFNNEAAVIAGWMASPPHRENLLDPTFTQVGFGFANSPDYTALGGQPATIFVAFYGRPADTVPVLASSPASGAAAPTTENTSSSTLGESTQIKQASLKQELLTWSPVAIAMAILVPLSLLAAKHILQVRRALKQGERFIWKHPLFDLALVIVVALALSLWQTAGLVK